MPRVRWLICGRVRIWAFCSSLLDVASSSPMWVCFFFSTPTLNTYSLFPQLTFLTSEKKKKETSRREHPHALTWLPAKLPPAPGLIIHPAPLPVTMGELSRVLTKNQLLWSMPYLFPCLVKVATTAVSPLSFIHFIHLLFLLYWILPISIQTCLNFSHLRKILTSSIFSFCPFLLLEKFVSCLP